ncbi:golvesin C-terminal-like domain-containing protein [Shewanella sedimentimangrovi]|uniref:Golvesin/Xly CBD-like domain-containing protein n=1 Tax=Shewanella sedimentimangrovi TaxID=2814293 RepID=A0ABX7R2N7_9GAMM|nr:hypothetical protein [Shewanella sedimentimangrovi]QSX37552.1 hypothetical protein JYB85_01520 [Shewanella sedimentimangrovi]
MKVNNALEDRALENVGVEVLFSDSAGEPVVASSDPNHPNASFFIRISSIEGIDNVAGTGELAAASGATIKWLIIPAPGSAGDVPTGTLYYVGAKLNYRLNGLDESINVAPDSIFVRPMPKLTLDYFLPSDVYADDPLTPEIEPIVPFTLGVRVSNNGKAAANKVKIQSAQPKIVENEQGLAIDFKITDSFVGDSPVTNSLLLDFGDIPSLSSGTGRWIMYTTLSGRFTEFTATFSHADELGGSLTSLIEAVNTHLLLRDIQVDMPGRDTVRDFLVRQADGLMAYESDSVDTPVTDHSGSASLTGSGDSRTLEFAPELGAAYVELADPFAGQRQLVQVLRSDGKVLLPSNAWQSKKYNKDLKQWQYRLHLFDTHTQGRYLLVFADPVQIPAAPVLAFIPDWTGAEGGQIGFLLEASDPNGDAVSFGIQPMPTGATLTDIEPGKARFNWDIQPGQAGFYPITVFASDGKLFSNQDVMLKVFPANDTDGDGLDDAWEIAHFGDLSRDGSGDYDGDGLSDKEEFELGSDPTMQNGPLAPEVIAPDQEEVTDSEILLQVNNSINLGNRPLKYFFEVYADAQMSQPVLHSEAVSEGVEQTSWLLPEALLENHSYFWRARSYNDVLYSPWVNAEFKINRLAEPPTKAVLNSPVVGTEVDDVLPLLSVINAADPDGDELSYRFALYRDETLTQEVMTSPEVIAGEDGVTQWRVSAALDEGSRYYWRVTVTDPDGLTSNSDTFWFNVYVSNQAPSAPVLVSPALDEISGYDALNIEVAASVDPEGQSLIYLFELDTVASFDSEALQTEQLSEDPQGKILWPLSGLKDKQQYFWRVRAKDPLGALSEPLLGRFSINLQLTAPSAPVVDNPGDGSWVQSTMPTLSVHPVLNSDRPVEAYQFELYADESLSKLLALADSPTASVELMEPLPDNSWVFWRVRAVDTAGIQGNWSQLSKFFVNDKGIDEEPVFEWRYPDAEYEYAPGDLIPLRWEDYDPDSDAQISLFYMVPENAIVLDDKDAGFTAYGNWRHWQDEDTRDGYHIFDVQGESAFAKWSRPLELSGRYEVQVYWPAITGKYANKVTYIFPVSGENGGELVQKELKAPQSGWNSLGEFSLTSGDFAMLLKGEGRKNRALIADQIRLIPVDVPSQLLVQDLPETPDGDADTYAWDTSSMQPGEYQLFARIRDNSHEITVYSPFKLVLRPRALQRFDDQDSNAIFNGNWAQADMSDAIGGAVHVLNLEDGAGSLAWQFSIAESGWYGVDFHALPGFALDQVEVELHHQQESILLGKLEVSSKAVWSTLGNYWIEAGSYELRARAQGSGLIALDAFEIKRSAVLSGNNVVVDNLDVGFSSLGNWHSVNKDKNHIGEDYLQSCQGQAEALWRVAVTDSGYYEISSQWVGKGRNSSDVRYDISFKGASRERLTSSVKVNQKRNGGVWQPLAVVKSEPGELNIKLSNSGAKGCVIADAIQIRKLEQNSVMLDNVPAVFKEVKGWWQTSTLTDGYVGDNYQFTLFGEAIWEANIPLTGRYRVESRWPASIFHSSAAEYAILFDGKVAMKKSVSQKKNGASWQVVGEVDISPDQAVQVRIRNAGHGFLVADAIRLVRIDSER